MKFKREDLVQVWTVLNSIANEKTTAKGAYGIAKNKRLVESEIKSIEDAQKSQVTPEGVQEFDTERLKACNEFCDKDEDGKPKVMNNNFVMTENTVVFNEKLAELQEEFKEGLEARSVLEEEFKVFLQEEVEVEIHTIKINDLPDNITATQIEALNDIVVD